MSDEVQANEVELIDSSEKPRTKKKKITEEVVEPVAVELPETVETPVRALGLIQSVEDAPVIKETKQRIKPVIDRSELKSKRNYERLPDFKKISVPGYIFKP